MRLDVVLDAVDEVGDLRHERVVRDIARGRLDGGKGPVGERSGIVLRRVDTVVLDRALGAEEADDEDVGRVGVEQRGQPDGRRIGEVYRTTGHGWSLVV